MKVTGERVMTPEGGFNPTWQRHVAAYAEAAERLPEGERVLDLGCGVGHSYHLLAPRETVGVDIDPVALAGQRRTTVAADMRALPFGDGEFGSVLSVQSLEHVPEPSHVLAEVTRVLKEDGVAIFVTPNRLTLGRPDEIIDPYHYIEFAGPELEELCGEWFEGVEVLGLFGSERYMELFNEERATLDRLLGLDPARLRRLVPNSAKRKLYDAMLRRSRRRNDPRAAAIEPGDFELHGSGHLDALDLFAVCTGPRPSRGRLTGNASSAFSAGACPWCAATLASPTLARNGRLDCQTCGAAVTFPIPDDAELEAAYNSWYRPRGRRFGFAGDAILKRTRGALAKRIDAIAPPGPVLDVGAGDGTLVDALAGRGRLATGLERASIRSDLLEMDISEVEGTWAAVVLWHSLEHLRNPGATIDEARRLLGPGGVLAVAVPNSESLQAVAFGSRWLHLDPPRHLIHLGTRTLVRGLCDRGFKIDRVSHLRGGQIVIGWLDGVVGSLPGGLDLYQSLRRPDARSRAVSPGRRLAAVAIAVPLLPIAVVAAALEAAARRGGTVYVEASVPGQA